MSTRRLDRLTAAILAVLSVLLIALGLASLRWRMLHDLPIMLYLAFLTERFGYVPYRDFFDVNMPGAQLVYRSIGEAAGYSDGGIRSADLLILATLLCGTALWLRAFSSRVAWAGAVLWGLLYLGCGPVMSLQREYLTLPCILAAAAFSTRGRWRHRIAAHVASGVCIGIAASIKPLTIVALVPLVLVCAFGHRSHSGRAVPAALARVALPMMVGVIIPLALLLYYLWSAQGMQAFVDIATQYWPLYWKLSGQHTLLTGLDRLKYLMEEYAHLGGHLLWIVPATIGTWAALKRAALPPERKRDIALLLALAFCFSLYPVLTGKFWGYHWLPFSFVVVQLAAFCLLRWEGQHSGLRLCSLAVLLLVFMVQVRAPRMWLRQLGGRNLGPPKHGRVDAIATYLQAHLRAGDRVQPLDWTGGAAHAMLLARARLATEFIYDCQFYHPVGTDSLRQLRLRFINELQTMPPEYVVEITAADKPWLSGPGTTKEFAELRAYLAREYTVAERGDGYLIYAAAPPAIARTMPYSGGGVGR